ncbi:MAG: hypothetical protein VR69_00245 [Peptococcaceae bacterium BRH_c4b]|nr:MAG: hypothetical protein VR69_00245 [Peptococcaceae bacterium BRH_c4b]
MTLEYESFPRHDIKTPAGNTMHLFIIPAGSRWFRPMGVDDVSALIQVTESLLGDMPARSVYIRKEMVDIDSIESRLLELMVMLDVFISRGVEGYCIYKTRENFKDEFMNGFNTQNREAVS